MYFCYPISAKHEINNPHSHLKLFTIIDIETTGGNALSEKITEIAIFVHDGMSVVDEFQTLINPEKNIPPFISRMTGISNEMVENAPKFYEVAKRIVEITDGKIFVAHNSQFDYSFVRQEFRNLGYDFKRDTLCTCKLSRKMLPGLPSYSLGRLSQSLNIELKDRHRAGGDAAATVKLFEKILALNKNNEVNKFIKPWNFYSNLPDEIKPELISNIPEDTGIYYFINDKNEIIYIGKSRNIKKRVLSHFKNKRSAKTLKLKEEIKDIRFEQTGSELISLLLESDEIKKHQPKYNRSRKKTAFKYGIFETQNSDGYTCLSVKEIAGDNTALAAFAHEQDALRSLDRKMKQFNLCSKFCGFEPMNTGACFDFKIKQCKGACTGEENNIDYNARVQKALGTFQYEQRDFLLIDRGRKRDEYSVVMIEKGIYSGYGYFETEFAVDNINLMKDCIKHAFDNPDTQHLIKTALRNKRYIKMIAYSSDLIN